jgi:PAS domain S-box-containing protein
LKLLTQRIPSMLYQYQMKAIGQNSRFTYCSDGIQRVFGLAPSDVVGKPYADSPSFKCVYPPDLDRILAATTASMEASGPAQCEFRLQQPDQSQRWVRGDFYAERQADGSFVWYGSCTDITELKEREEALRVQSITDELTGIYNRRYFMENLERQIAQGRRHGVSVSLIMIDLDHFKQINDRWGA